MTDQALHLKWDDAINRDGCWPKLAHLVIDVAGVVIFVRRLVRKPAHT